MPDLLKTATFNLYNLQLPGKKMYSGKPYTKAQYAAKVEWSARMIQQLDADIIGFQELWDKQCLEDVFKAAGLIGDYTLRAEDANPGGIDNAIAVRKPHKITSAKWIADFPAETVLKKDKGGPGAPDYEMSVSIDKFSRPILRANVKWEHKPGETVKLIVVVVHLKSKIPIRLDKDQADDPKIRRHRTALGQALSNIRRTAEAAALRVILTNLMKGNDDPVIVAGDVNDDVNTVTTAIITGQPKFRLFADSRVGKKSDAGLYGVSTMQAYRSLKDVGFTHIFDGKREILDHILVSEQFYDYSDRRIWSFNNARCYNDFLDDDKKHTGDHAPVCATFDYNPAK